MLDLRNMDCMELMRQYPDKHFDLAIVDPPYGIGFDGEDLGMVNCKSSGKWANPSGKSYERKEWDKSTPDKIYFDELFRVSKNQIIWGGNYFDLPPSGGWIIWDKKKPEDFSLSQGEMAWNSKSNSVRFFRFLWHGFQQESGTREDKIHPTQKPSSLYRWILSKYAKPGDLILDTHLGSGSIAIACHDMGFDLVASELDADYFTAMQERLARHTAQGNLFKPQIEPEEDVRQDLSLFPAPEASA